VAYNLCAAQLSRLADPISVESDGVERRQALRFS
jgi:hypothetical protein